MKALFYYFVFLVLVLYSEQTLWTIKSYFYPALIHSLFKETWVVQMLFLLNLFAKCKPSEAAEYTLQFINQTQRSIFLTESGYRKDHAVARNYRDHA
jgi:hypothetical protein